MVILPGFRLVMQESRLLRASAILREADCKSNQKLGWTTGAG
jgi:hypothetical protein